MRFRAAVHAPVNSQHSREYWAAATVWSAKSRCREPVAECGPSGVLPVPSPPRLGERGIPRCWPRAASRTGCPRC